MQLRFVHKEQKRMQKRTRRRFKWVLSISIVLFTLSESDVTSEESDVAKKWVHDPLLSDVAFAFALCERTLMLLCNSEDAQHRY